MRNSNAERASEHRINRRAYISALSVVGGTAIAGCSSIGDGSGGEDGEDAELGERVPQLDVSYPGGLGGLSETLSQVADIFRGNAEGLGLNLEVDPTEIGTLVGQMYDDAREQNLVVDGSSTSPERLDPDPKLLEYSILHAGEGNPPSRTQFANCDFSELAHQSTEAPSEEERRNLVHDAMAIQAEEVADIPVTNYTFYAAARNDQLDIGDPGPRGVTPANIQWILDEISTDQSVIVGRTTGDITRDLNHFRIDNAGSLVEFNQKLYSTLFYYDKNWDLQPYLAEDYEVEDEFRTITVTMRDHVDENGDPITAEDAKWIFELVSEYSNEIVRADSQPYTSIEAVDDRTVQFNFEDPNPSFIGTTLVRWGILPRDVWIDAGAGEENPLDVIPEEIVSTGPYKVGSFSEGQSLTMVPNEEHWQAPDHDHQIVRFEGVESLNRAFRGGEVNVFNSPGATVANDLKDQDWATVSSINGFTRYYINPYNSFAPTKFREFRLALSQCLNRQEINQVAFYGDAELITKGTIFGTTHPYYPDDDSILMDIAPSGEGDVEAARQTLSDAGWGWDNDGRLHYPPDADLSPVFEQGETPANYPDEFPCVEELKEEYDY